MSVRLASGFSLLELLVTLAVLAIVLAVAAPSLTPWFAAQRLAGATEAVSDLLRQARKHAITGQHTLHLHSLTGDAWTLSADPSATAACTAALLCVDGSDYRGVRLSTSEPRLQLSPLKALPRTSSGNAAGATFTLSHAGCSDSKVVLLATGFIATEPGRCR